MVDIRLISINQRVPVYAMFDWLLLPTGALDETQELASAVTVALGTDRLADDDDDLPDIESTDRRGWWGDLDAAELWDGWPIGSRLWLLMRGKITDSFAKDGSTLARAEEYIREALMPFIDKKVASQIDVAVTRGIDNYSSIVASVVLYRGPLPDIALEFQILWDGITT
jgi:phage gp46-like protein